jgi:hypothetical protein
MMLCTWNGNPATPSACMSTASFKNLHTISGDLNSELCSCCAEQ